MVSHDVFVSETRHTSLQSQVHNDHSFYPILIITIVVSWHRQVCIKVRGVKSGFTIITLLVLEFPESMYKIIRTFAKQFLHTKEETTYANW